MTFVLAIEICQYVVFRFISETGRMGFIVKVRKGSSCVCVDAMIMNWSEENKGTSHLKGAYCSLFTIH